MQPPGQGTLFRNALEGRRNIGRTKEDCFLPRHLWGAETYDWHITWGCARNLACPRLPSLAPPELKPLSGEAVLEEFLSDGGT